MSSILYNIIKDTLLFLPWRKNRYIHIHTYINILFPSPQRIYYWGVVKISEKYSVWKYQLWNHFMTNLNYWVGIESAIQSVKRILLKCVHAISLFSLSHSDTHTHTHTQFIFLSSETYFSISLFFQYKYEINTSLPINLGIHCFISPTKHFTSTFLTVLYEFFFN